MGRPQGGTFDEPPIIIRRNRRKALLMCLGLASAAAFLYWRFPGYFLGPLSMGLVGAYIGWCAVARGGLILSPSGLVWKEPLLTFTYAWSDFDSFSVVQVRAKMVAGKPSAVCKSRRWWWLRPWSFGSSWELPAEKLVDVLDEARRRWGPQGMPS